MTEAKTLARMKPEEIEKQYGVKVKNGKIAVSRGNYYAVVEGKRHKIDLQFVYSAKPVDKLFKNGTPVGFIMIGGAPAVIIGRPSKYFQPVMCYIMAADIKKRIDTKIRGQMINTLVAESRMPAALGNQILNELAAGK